MTTIQLTLPRPHAGQREVIQGARRFNAVACGRRFGKTTLGVDRLIRPALEGKPAAWFSPTYKMLGEVWRTSKNVLGPVTQNLSVQNHRIDLITGGTIEMWSLDNADSCRGRKYARVVLDEAAMVRNLEDAWNAVIRPTLTDYQGDGYLLSTPKGRNFFWTAFANGEDPKNEEWASFQMPTAANPHIPASEIEAMRLSLPERLYQQEILAVFLEEAGGVFRGVRDAIDAGRKENEHSYPSKSYCLGVDLARVEDFTVLDVVDDQRRQVYHERFNQISWERQIERIERVARQYGNAQVFIDSTGVGDPIFETLRKRGLHIRPYTLTSGSKEALIDALAMSIEQGQLRLMDLPVQTNELLAYEYQLTASRNVRMSAPEGLHDDCVIALALASWGWSNRKRLEFS